MSTHSTIPVAARPAFRPLVANPVIGGMAHEDEWVPEESYPTKMARLALRCGMPTRAGDTCPVKKRHADDPMCVGHARSMMKRLTELR